MSRWRCPSCRPRRRRPHSPSAARSPNRRRAASVTASTAATVSPAPETSRTLTGWAGTWTTSPLRGTSVMPCSLCVTSMASQSASCIASCAASAMLSSRVGAAAGGLGEFLAIGRQQRRAAIDREIGALGIDDDGLAEFSRGVDDVADHARRQHALGVVGQQHDIGARRAAAGWRRSASARCRRRPAWPAPSPRAACGWRNARRRSAPCASSAAPDRTPARFRSALSRESSAFSCAPASSSPIRPTKMQRAPSEAMLRATLPAPPILVSLRCTAMTGAGASGEIRDTSP